MKTNPGTNPRAPQLAAVLGVEVDQIPRHREFQALAKETDPALFEDGLLSLAGQMERRGREAVAARAYAEIRGEKAALAHRRLAALGGGGEIGDRAETLVRQASLHLFDAPTLGGMLVAGGAFRMARLSLGAALAAQPARFLTRGAAARSLASFGAFSVEALAFPLSARGLSEALDRPTPVASWDEDLKRSFLSLGALRFFGGAARLVAPHRRLLPELGMLGGLFTAHRLEERLDWRPRSSAEQALVDSLALFVQFHAAGRLLQGFSSRSWRRWTREVDFRVSQGPALYEVEGWRPLLVSQSSGSGPGHLAERLQEPTDGGEAVARRPSSKPPKKDLELAEFKTETGHLAHDISGGLTSLSYNLPLLRNLLNEVNLIQASLIQHYRNGGGEPPAELARQVENLFRVACDPVEPPNLSSIERIEWRINEIRLVTTEVMDSVEKRLSELIEMSNEFRHLAAGRPEFTLARLDGILDDPYLEMHLGPRIRLSSYLPSKIFVSGPDTTLRRVFQNLLVNTREALENQEFPIVRVTGRDVFLGATDLADLVEPRYGFEPKPGGYWLIRIQDNGAGIPAEVLARIFDSGFSTKPSLSHLGTIEIPRGLGLAQVHKAVKSRGGFIRVTSTAGSGATFEVYLPNLTY